MTDAGPGTGPEPGSRPPGPAAAEPLEPVRVDPVVLRPHRRSRAIRVLAGLLAACSGLAGVGCAVLAFTAIVFHDDPSQSIAGVVALFLVLAVFGWLVCAGLAVFALTPKPWAGGPRLNHLVSARRHSGPRRH